MNLEWRESGDDKESPREKIEKIMLEFLALFEKYKNITSNTENETEEKALRDIYHKTELLQIENEQVLLLQKILELSLDNLDKFNWEDRTKSNPEVEGILYSEFKLNLGIVKIILRHYSIEKGQENVVEPKNNIDDQDNINMDLRRDVYQVFIDNKLKGKPGNKGTGRYSRWKRQRQRDVQLPKVTINVLPSINQYGKFDNIQDDKPELKKKRFRTHSLDFLDAEERTKLNEMIQRLSDLLEDREEEKPDNSDWWK